MAYLSADLSTTAQVEIIDGHKYLVERDTDGRIVSQSARDDTGASAPNLVIINGKDMLAQPPDKLDASDVAAMLQFLIKRELGR